VTSWISKVPRNFMGRQLCNYSMLEGDKINFGMDYAPSSARFAAHGPAGDQTSLGPGGTVESSPGDESAGYSQPPLQGSSSHRASKQKSSLRSKGNNPFRKFRQPIPFFDSQSPWTEVFRSFYATSGVGGARGNDTNRCADQLSRARYCSKTWTMLNTVWFTGVGML
jgi:hypothetical protein